MKPIIFSTKMVKAILDGRKSMTRRVVTPQPKYELRPHRGRWHEYSENPPADIMCNSPWGKYYEPKCQPGDILWVRETWRCTAVGKAGESEFAFIEYKTGESAVININSQRSLFFAGTARWRPSIFMPREAARIFLEVKSVRIERVQDITPLDCMKEGVDFDHTDYDGHIFDREIKLANITALKKKAKEAYCNLWDHLNAKRGYGWDVNPWVWVYEFEKKEEAQHDV